MIDGLYAKEEQVHLQSESQECGECGKTPKFAVLCRHQVQVGQAGPEINVNMVSNVLLELDGARSHTQGLQRCYVFEQFCTSTYQVSGKLFWSGESRVFSPLLIAFYGF